jgi:hypothetical protein
MCIAEVRAIWQTALRLQSALYSISRECLSQKTRYTIRALMHLADKYQQGLVPLHDIAEAQNIPAKFLTVILSEMSRAGLVVVAARARRRL